MNRPSSLMFWNALCATISCLVACMHAMSGEPMPEDTPVDRSVLSTPIISDSDVPQAVRSILSNRCFACHGPDDAERQGGIRLDKIESFLAAADSGLPPVIPQQPADSELLRRVASADDGERMPPPSFGAPLTQDEVALIQRWIQLGAELPAHWSFVAPVRPALPEVQLPSQNPLAKTWSEQPLDRFILAQQVVRGFEPSPEATRAELLRRLSLDLIGLPPTPEELAAYESDQSPAAYERQVDRLLASPAFGEHWARKWLDLARYADSAGYADDPERTIWAYRDWVINALNDNMPLDQFTIEQLAGDLLPNATHSQLVATAFHRNTLTNNEGGTNDEEFRNVAVVDRVNTTMAVWMGVTMGCAQCHTHKYDPLTHAEYFQLFDIFNQSQDADRRDESPFIELFTEDQLQLKRQHENRLIEIEAALSAPDEASRSQFDTWRAGLVVPRWQALPAASLQVAHDGTSSEQAVASPLRVQFEQVPAQATYTLSLPLDSNSASVTAVALDSLPNAELPGGGAGYGGGNFVLTDVTAWLEPEAETSAAQARYVRLALSGPDKMLSLAEVQVFEKGQNIALHGTVTQSSTDFGGDASRAIDGNTDGIYTKNSTTHTAVSNDPWWELDLGSAKSVEQLAVWNRTDNGLQSRLDGAVVTLLDESRNIVFTHRLEKAPEQQQEIAVRPKELLKFAAAYADYEQGGFPAAATIDGDPQSGWAVGGQHQQPHRLTLVLEQPLSLAGSRRLTIELKHQSSHTNHLLGSFSLATTDSSSAADWAKLPVALQQAVVESRETGELLVEHASQLLLFFHRNIASASVKLQEEATSLRRELSQLKPATSVPVMRELNANQTRKTFVQLRGNYKSLGDEVTAGTPEVFHPLEDDGNGIDRLDLARWLVDRRNPLTARVFVNRLWESLFGLGIVRTSEEFGSQGDAPTHPELLDWLACEAMDCGWDMKRMLRLLVTSHTYRQTSMVTHERLEADRDNIWLSRGPRVRLSAEMIRDQALAAAGILTRRMHGPPVRPPQPRLGLTAAFGSNTDWTVSEGEDRYRRGIYTTWRRSNPYPSMATFDAPSREVCTLRRDATNTPLQALVTLNDPAFVEAAQALARRVVLQDRKSSTADAAGQLQHAFLLCTSRVPTPAEMEALQSLLNEARVQLSDQPAAANSLASDPLGPLPEGADPVELAAWTAVCNVLLNLDEVLMKR